MESTVEYRTSLEEAIPTAEEAKADLFAMFDHCHPHEVARVREHLQAGEFDGGCIRNCIIGIIARCRRTDYECMPEGTFLAPENNLRVFEKWLVRICEGHTPNNNPDAALLDIWLSEWLDERTIDFEPTYPRARRR